MKKLKIYSITKQDIQDALQDVLYEFMDLRDEQGVDCPVPYDKINLHVGFTTGVNNWGRCHRHNGKFDILVGRKYLSGYLSPECLRSTLIHEIIHTFPGCQNHGEKFQYWARRLSRLMNTDIRTHTTPDETKQGTYACFEESKNALVCLDCGEIYLHPTMAANFKKWRRTGRPDRICSPCMEKYKHKNNLLVIKYDGESLIDGKMCDDSIMLRAAAWLKKHVPPKELLGNEPFVWTPEKVVNEYWWKDEPKAEVETEIEEPVLKVANGAPVLDAVQIVPSTKKRCDITGPFSYEQMSLF